MVLEKLFTRKVFIQDNCPIINAMVWENYNSMMVKYMKVNGIAISERDKVE